MVVPNIFWPMLMESIELESCLNLQPQSIQFIDHDVKFTRNKDIPLSKVVWEGSPLGEAMWELVLEMQSFYAHRLKYY